jgi:hypothetical protein
MSPNTEVHHGIMLADLQPGAYQNRPRVDNLFYCILDGGCLLQIRGYLLYEVEIQNILFPSSAPVPVKLG